MGRRLFHLLATLTLALGVMAACGQSPAPAPTPEPTAQPAPPEPAATESPVQASGAAEGGMRLFAVVPEGSQASYVADEEFFSGALAKYGIDPGFEDAIGTTTQVGGQLMLNLQGPDYLGESRITVDLTGLQSNRSQRDNWIQNNGPSFSRFPLAEFVPTELLDPPAAYQEGSEVSFRLAGDLTIRGITRPVTFDVTASLTDGTITGRAEAQILLTDFGIDPPDFANTLTVKNEMGIRVQLTARSE